MSRWLPSPILSGFLFAMWLLLNQSLAPAHALFAAVLAVWLPLLTLPLRPNRPRSVRRCGLMVRLFFTVVFDISRSAFAVGGVILGAHARRQTSGFMTVALDLADAHGLAILSMIISSTPGTVWVEHDPERKRLLIHVLDLHDEQWWIDTIKNRYEKPLMAIFE